MWSTRPDSILGSFGAYEARWMTMTAAQTKVMHSAANSTSSTVPVIAVRRSLPAGSAWRVGSSWICVSRVVTASG